jgi:membrane protein implicated in regulation of membrane protease activity
MVAGTTVGAFDAMALAGIHSGALMSLCGGTCSLAGAGVLAGGALILARIEPAADMDFFFFVLVILLLIIRHRVKRANGCSRDHAAQRGGGQFVEVTAIETRVVHVKAPFFSRGCR